jgi:transposase InsO family protein
MAAMKGAHPVKLLCELLMVSRSGYYRWRARRPTKRQRDDARLAAQIAAAHARSRQTYGAPQASAATPHDRQPPCAGPPRGCCITRTGGVQYACHDYAAALAAAGLTASVSRRGNCYDNAPIESFWSTSKTETGLDAATPLSPRAAELFVFDYIETFYNPTRRHGSLGYLSPVAFEDQPTKNDIKAA